MKKSGENKRRYFKMATAILLALVLAFSVLVIMFSSISSTSSRYSESETYTGSVTAGEHDTSHDGWTKISSLSHDSNNVYTISSSGNYYLDKDFYGYLDCSENSSITVTLCLNGHMMTGGDNTNRSMAEWLSYVSSVITTNCTFNLCDCGGSSVTRHYYKLENYPDNIRGQELKYYNFSDVTDSEIPEIEKGDTAGGYVEGGVITGGFINFGLAYAGTAGAGIAVRGGRFNMYGGTISGNLNGWEGGGITVSGGGYFNMYGGSIEGNCCFCYFDDQVTNMDSFGFGGGVFIIDSTMNMYDGTVSNNYALSGGGIEVYCDQSNSQSVLNMRGGSISYNHAVSGPGVEMSSGYGNSTGIFYMYDGIIEGNEAKYLDYEDSYGDDFRHFDTGAVHIGYEGEFHMSGGRITNNVVTHLSGCSCGAGIYLRGSANTTYHCGSIILGDDAYVFGNKSRLIDNGVTSETECNIGFYSNSYCEDVTVESTLTDNALIGFTCNGTAPTENSPVQITKADTGSSNIDILNASVDRFVSDDEKYEIKVNTSGGYLELCLKQ